jgi:hypothetical protein
LTELLQFVDVVGAEAQFQRASVMLGRASFSAMARTDIQRVAQQLADVRDKVVRVQAFQEQDPTPLEVVRSSSSALALASHVGGRLTTAASGLFFLRSVGLLRTAPDGYFEVVKLLTPIRMLLGAALSLRFPVRVEIPPELTAALSVLTAWASRILRFLSLSWWRARGVIRRALPSLSPEQAQAPLTPQLVAELKHRADASGAWLRFDEVLQRLQAVELAPLHAEQLQVRLEELDTALSCTHELHGHWDALSAMGAWPDIEIDAWRSRLQWLGEIGRAHV